MNIDSRAEFDKWAWKYADDEDAWEDMGLDEHFIAGYEAGQASRQAIEGEAVAYDMGDEIYVENSGDMNDYIRQNGRPLIYGEPYPASAVPKGWTIEPFDDGFGVEGISVLWPDKRGGAHLRANDPKNSIAQNLLYDLADAILFDSPASADVTEGFSSPAEATLAGCKCVLYGRGNRHWPCPIHSSADRPTLGQRKADQVGTTIGVLVQTPAGSVAAVTDLGRCTWLNQDVTGAGAGVSVPTHQRAYECDGAFGCLDCGAQWGTLPGDPKEPEHCAPAKGGEAVSVPDAWSVVTDDSHIQYTAMVDKNIGLPLDQSNDFAWQQCNEMIQEWIEQGMDAASRYVIRPIALITTPTKAAVKPSGFEDMDDMELLEWANTCRRAKQEQDQ